MASDDDDLLRVMVHNQRLSSAVGVNLDRTSSLAHQALLEAGALIDEFADLIPDPQAPAPATHVRAVDEPLDSPSWQALVEEAQRSVGEAVSYRDLLDEAEMREVASYQAAFQRQWTAQTGLDRWDLMAASLSGLTAAIVDLIYVGGPSVAVGKKVSTWLGAPVEHKPDSPAVTFDKTLGKEYGAKGNHRWNSASHSPSLGGFVSAVWDVLNGTSTHVVDGRIVTVENMTKKAARTMGKTLKGDFLYSLEGFPILQRVLAAIQIVVGHWWSDFNTSMGLPAPWMLLAKFLNFGRIQIKGQTLTISELAHKLFRDGLDLRRFLADGLVATVNEVFVRLWMLFRKLSSGGSLREALSAAVRTLPKQRKALLCAHGVTAACNAGKVWCTGNPLLINLAQWTAFAAYLQRHLRWAVFERDSVEESAHIRRWSEDLRASLVELGEIEAQLAGIPILRLVA